MPTRQQINDDFSVLLGSTEWQSATIEEKKSLFTAFLQSRQNLWELVENYIDGLFDKLLELIVTNNPTAPFFTDIIDQFFEETLQSVFPWPVSGEGN